jgi:F-type H+-transporting ATPase subunit a
MIISPDQIIFYKWQFELFGKDMTFNLNMTLVGTWFVMLLIFIICRMVTKNLNDELKISKWQNVLEVLVTGTKSQVEDIMQRKPGNILYLIGTLFIFILTANITAVFPIPVYSPYTNSIEYYIPPTGSFSTTLALAIVVFLAVPYLGIRKRGIFSYLKDYAEPKIFLLPLNILGEISGRISLAIRLYGNIMSGTILVTILLLLAPLFLPALFQIYGLLSGVIQAFIFAILALVYITGGLGEPTEAEIEALQKENENNY